MTGDTLLTAGASLAAAFVGGWIGASATWKSQTRAIRLRERAIARALLQDLRRIEQLVPDEAHHRNTWVSHEQEYPGVHGWVQPLIVDMAGRDAAIVGDYMELEAMLEDHRRKGGSLWSCQATVDSVTNNIAHRKAQGQTEHPSSEELQQSLASAVNARYAALEAWQAADAQLHQHFATLRGRLGKVAALPVPDGPLGWRSDEH